MKDWLLDPEFFDNVLLVLSIMIPVMFFAEKWIKAPMGKLSRDGWGPTVNPQVGWIIMEIATIVVFFPVFFLGERALQPVPLFFAVLWGLQYFDRTLIYPFRLNPNSARLVLFVPLNGFLFQCVNSYLNAAWITQFGPDYGSGWWTDPRFIIGAVVFLAGYRINRQSDDILRNLRKPGETGYKIPQGGMFKYVSCAHYFGEIIMWFGWALATWSPPGLAFAIFTAANIGTRAWNQHKWYHEKFPDYPAERKAVIPFVI